MRVALVTRTLVDDGGIAVAVRRSAAALRAHGIEVSTVAGEQPGDDGLTVRGLRGDNLNDAERGEVLREIDSFGADVAHFHNVDDPELIRRTDAATVVSAHAYSGCGAGTHYFRPGHECTRAHGPLCVVNMAARNCNHRWDPRAIAPAYRAAGRRVAAARAADHCVVYSSAIEDHMRHNGITRITRVPLHIDVPNRPAARPDADRILFVGRLVPAKGVDVLLRAARHFDAPIDICGTGRHEQHLRRLTARLGLTDRVVFHGWVDEAALVRRYERAAVAVIPSIWPEPWGMVGAEALAHGVPVVGSDTGGIPDWLGPAGGVLVAPGDPRALGRAIAALLADRARRTAIASDGQVWVREHLTAERHVSALSLAYETALSHGRTNRLLSPVGR
jgi:glycosyltransferase involved in cell wall biosynthesis